MPKENQKEYIQIRVTKEFKDKITSKASEIGATTSGYIKMILSKALKSRK